MTQETVTTILLVSPLLIGGLIAAINSESVNNATEKAEAWTRRNQTNVASKDGWFNSYVINPILWMVVKFCDWTDGFTHRGFKNGARVSATLYLIAAWCYILYAAALLAIMLLIGAAAVYIVFKIVFNSNDSQSSVKRNRTLKNSDEMDVTDMVGLRGQKIYSGTNWLTEELNGRVDDEGNIYEGTNWLTEQKIGRIDKDGTIYKGTSWMTEVKVGRIDKDGTIHKGSNWFTEQKIGRIDEDGNIQKGTNWLTEKKSGRIGD